MLGFGGEKTSHTCFHLLAFLLTAALAIKLADEGLTTAVVSTDPAHSLGDALDLDLSSGRVTEVQGLYGSSGQLFALEVGLRVGVKAGVGVGVGSEVGHKAYGIGVTSLVLAFDRHPDSRPNPQP